MFVCLSFVFVCQYIIGIAKWVGVHVAVSHVAVSHIAVSHFAGAHVDK